ncbi:DUF5677 domain-containing protein [Streptomyces bauhiniae]|nr:DUF5677 domain-containing protein [Streptomyces bauhiniae]
MVLDGTITDPNTMDRDEVFRAALDAVLMKAAEIDPVVRRSIKWSMKYGRQRRARTAQHNERSILKKLGTGFRLLSNAVTVAEDVHRDLFRSFGQKLAEDGLSRDSVIAAPGVIGGSALHVLVILGLHARGCSIVSEVDLLARKGFNEGALARARSLYEVTAITSFLVVRNTPTYELTERYHLSAMVERRKDARFMGEEDPFADAPGLEDAMRAAWGDEVFRPYGWARTGIPGAEPGSRVTFRDVEEAAVMDSLRHAYLTMNCAIHSGALSVTARSDRAHPFFNPIGGEVNYASAAWVAGATSCFFFFLNQLAIREIASLVDPDAALMLGPLDELCESAQGYFGSYYEAHCDEE